MPVPVPILCARLLAIAVLSIAALAASVAEAGAKPGKPYSLVVESPQWAGVTDAAYTVTLTNDTTTQELGSADVTIPAQLTIVGEPSISGGAVSRSGNLLMLRNLAMQPGGSVTVTLGLRMTCAAGSYAWSVDAKQSNDFNGLPGNTLGPVSGTLSTTVQGICELRFVGQPAGAQKDELIRAAPFDQGSTELVSVEALDGSPAPQRLTWFTGPIAIAPAPGSFSASAPPTVVDGLFSYSGLKLGDAGTYVLRATRAGFDTGVSSAFQIVDVAQPCNGSKCDATLAGSLTSTTINGALGPGDEGHVLLSLSVGTEPECAGYDPPSDDWYEFLVTAARDKTITVSYSRNAMRRINGGASALQICFATPEPFTAKTGPAGPFDYDGDAGNGDEGFVGLLADCGDVPAGEPCILDRAPAGGGRAVVTFFVPARIGDPRHW